MREFFVEARDWCVLVRLSRVACVGGVRVVAAVWPAGSALSRDITGALRVSRFFLTVTNCTLNAVLIN